MACPCGHTCWYYSGQNSACTVQSTVHIVELDLLRLTPSGSIASRFTLWRGKEEANSTERTRQWREATFAIGAANAIHSPRGAAASGACIACSTREFAVCTHPTRVHTTSQLPQHSTVEFACHLTLAVVAQLSKLPKLKRICVAWNRGGTIEMSKSNTEMRIQARKGGAPGTQSTPNSDGSISWKPVAHKQPLPFEPGLLGTTEQSAIHATSDEHR
jgi:hypothetical protein